MDDRGYLFIFEDETFLWVDDIDDDDIQAAVDGYVTIINLTDMTSYSTENVDENWTQIIMEERNFA